MLTLAVCHRFHASKIHLGCLF